MKTLSSHLSIVPKMCTQKLEEGALRMFFLKSRFFLQMNLLNLSCETFFFSTSGLPTPSPTPTSPTCFKCSNGPCIDLKKRCDFVDNDCSDNSDETSCGYPCDFTNNMCGWTNSKVDNFDWRRHRGCTGSITTGPCKDADNSTTGELSRSWKSVRVLGSIFVFCVSISTRKVENRLILILSVVKCKSGGFRVKKFSVDFGEWTSHSPIIIGFHFTDSRNLQKLKKIFFPRTGFLVTNGRLRKKLILPPDSQHGSRPCDPSGYCS